MFFELNGQPREVSVVDQVAGADVEPSGRRPSPAIRKHVGAPMPGMVVTVAVEGRRQGRRKGQKLFTLEAMKMETTISSDGKVGSPRCWSKPGSRVEAGDLLLRVE